MNSRYQTDDDLQDLHDSRGQDREISLGTTTILAIFFALVMLCAAFFGLGYGLGRKSAQPVVNAAETPTSSSEPSSSKPAPGSIASRSAAALPATQSADADQPSMPSGDSPSVIREDSPPPTPAPVKASGAVSRSDARLELVAKSSTKPAAAAVALPAGPGVAVVQVAAVSHQEDADVLITALKRRGYTVAIHHEPQDKLLHVQIGPFATKKDADAMRQRLQTDGYNAIVK